MQMNHYLPRNLPEPLRGLATLALDLRWNWHHGGDELWQAVDPTLWEATSNPWLILESVSDQRLATLAGDAQFLKNLQQRLAEREAHFQEQAWFPSQYGSDFSGYIAYFSMEFALSESLPIYSGGLGVLAGDYLKTACDLDVPLIAIGLLYQQGYFRQAVDAQGEQIEFYPYNDPTMLPVTPLRDDQGEWVHVTVELPGRDLRLRAWHTEVGRRSLLLLDSNHLLNNPGDRGITSELYAGGPEMRLQQELVLGIGGWRLLETLGIDCPICHLNEGHAAFAILERARHFMVNNDVSFDIALRATRAGNLFTTHTPVAAGFDCFTPELMNVYFRDYAEQLKLPLNELLALGRMNPADNDAPFNMAYLAVHGAAAVNGVSRLHGEVSRGIFQPLFPRWPRSEVPVGYVTNGVHVPSWDSVASDTLWTEACGQSRWRGTLETVEEDLRRVSDEVLWRFRADGRRRLIAFVRKRLVRQHCGRGATPERLLECTVLLDPDVLTLGFARRFAEYKRPNLLLHDSERLIRLLGNRDHPVQLVFAGKAHPRDEAGKDMLRQWQKFLEHPQVRDKVVFIEDYDLDIAAELIQGVDVWVNTPRRPWEASGTSGMKVLVNGGLNLSELDGWWVEAYKPELGWALGDGGEHEDIVAWDAAEAEQLYNLLEKDVVPCFYRRDEHGLPRDWIERIRESMACLTAQFSSNRMMRQYVETYYLPLAAAYRRRAASKASELQNWYTQLRQHWQKIHFGNVTSSPTQDGHHFEVQAYLDELPPDSVRIEIYGEPQEKGEPVRVPLQRGALLAGAVNAYVYQGDVASKRPVSDFTPRIIPQHAEAIMPLDADFILWYR